MHPLENPVRDYAWGSRTHIPKLLGNPPAGHPCAEMWMGAHQVAPSTLPDGRTLSQAICDQPEEMLGKSVRTDFGDRLPFLMKLLAAAEPLSLQVHPTSERARIRYAEQEAAGIPLDAPERSYPDASHKPELIYALTRFEGMAGFRDLEKSAAILRGLELSWLDVIAERFEGTTTPFQTLREVVTELLGLSGPSLEKSLRELHAATTAAEVRSHARTAGLRRVAAGDPNAVDRESVRVYAATGPLIERYPADPGVLVALLLNHVVLAAGEAMFIDAGTIHAYTSGFGLEIMAASDNVLRAGLTTKHVDVPELLAVTNFTPMPPPLWAANRLDPVGRRDATVLTPPVAEFELVVLHLHDESTDLRTAPQVVLCLDGEVEVSSTADTTRVRKGSAVFVAGTETGVVVRGTGHVAVGRTPP
ncbi:MAG: mannose-6-phosphate isomerase, class I [Nocardioidaceae bacterium]|nr:mannose-6-phosphate isomerase, class I [Nocardioidaceae bacterium]